MNDLGIITPISRNVAYASRGKNIRPVMKFASKNKTWSFNFLLTSGDCLKPCKQLYRHIKARAISFKVAFLCFIG